MRSGRAIPVRYVYQYIIEGRALRSGTRGPLDGSTTQSAPGFHLRLRAMQSNTPQRTRKLRGDAGISCPLHMPEVAFKDDA